MKINMRNPQKGSILQISLLIIAVAVIGVGIYIYQSKKSPQVDTQSNPATSQADWKIYNNKKSGYEIKYPSGYVLDEVSNPVIESATRDITTINSNEVRIGIIANSDKKSIDDECRDVSTYAPLVQIGNNKFNLIVSETATTDMGNPDNVYRNYYLKTQRSCYLISATYAPSLSQNVKERLNSEITGIIATFRINPEGVANETKQPSVSILTPTVGTIWSTNGTFPIKWTTDGVAADSQGYILLKNIAQGGDYYVIDKSVALNGGNLSNYGGSRNYTVPSESTSFLTGKYLIRIGVGRYEDYSGTKSVYFDSAPFEIKSPK